MVEPVGSTLGLVPLTKSEGIADDVKGDEVDELALALGGDNSVNEGVGVVVSRPELPAREDDIGDGASEDGLPVAVLPLTGNEVGLTPVVASDSVLFDASE